MVSQRAKNLINQPQPLVAAHFKCKQNPYSEENAAGYLSLGTAENYLLDELSEQRLQQIPDLTASQLHYQPAYGTSRLRNAISQFVEENFSIDVDAEQVIVASGCSALLEMLAYTLFDHNDQVIIPTPLYTGFIHDFSLRFGVEVIPVDCFDENYQLLPERINDALIEHTRVKAILICSPINPLGYCWPLADLEALVDLIADSDVHLIADEIYANSVFGETEFCSIHCLNTRHPRVKDRLHSLYGMAKDFGLSGLKVGYFFSYNEDVLTTMRNLAYFHTVSTQTQHTCSELLEDRRWCKHIHDTNQQSLQQAFGYFQQQLTSLGMSCFNSDAGVFTWLDLRAYLRQPNFDAEMQLFNHLVDDLRVNISPGQYFLAKEAGYFRVCYAQPRHCLQQFFQRLARLEKPASV